MTDATPATDPKPRAARIPRTTEVLSAGSLFGRLISGLMAVNSSVDDAEREYGPRLYSAMMNDPAVGSSVDVLRQGAVRLPTLSPPKEFRARPGTEPTPEQTLAATICERRNRALNNPERPLIESLNEWAYGLVEDKLAEIVLDKVTDGPDKGLLTFSRFKFKPRESWKYVVDPYGNVPFVAGVLPIGVQPPNPDEAIVVPGTGANAVLLESDRFAVFSWGRKDSDPRCHPITRRAYNGWNLKVRTWPEKLKGDVQFGTPNLAAIMPENMSDPDPDEVAGLFFSDGSPVQATAEDLFLWSLEQIANGSASSFPFGTLLHVIESKRDGLSLNESIELYNREIATAILHAPRTTQEGKHGGKNESESSGDVTQLLVNLIRATLCGLITNMVRTLTRLNEGPEAAATMCPVVEMGDGAHQDLAPLVTAYAAWVASGAPTEAQLAEIDAKLDMNPRMNGEKSLADLSAERAAQATADAAALKPETPKPKGPKP